MYACINDLLVCISIYERSGCQEALGMEDETIPDAQISASTEYSANYAAKCGRLNSEEREGAWTPKANDVNQWIQVDLGDYTIVTWVATQGSYIYNEWVSMYKLQYSDNGVNFQYHREQGETIDKVRWRDFIHHFIFYFISYNSWHLKRMTASLVVRYWAFCCIYQ